MVFVAFRPYGPKYGFCCISPLWAQIWFLLHFALVSTYDFWDRVSPSFHLQCHVYHVHKCNGEGKNMISEKKKKSERCMCACLCVCLYVRRYICMYLYACMRACTYVVYMHVYMYVYIVCIYVYACVHVYIYVRMCVICMCAITYL